MSFTIETVRVRLRCIDEGDPMGISSCQNSACPKCHGQGTYSAQITWNDFIREVRNELAPPPDSTR